MDERVVQILTLISESQQPIKVSELKGRVPFAKSTLAGGVRRLWDLGMIDRIHLGIGTGKGFEYTITEKGKETLEQSETN